MLICISLNAHFIISSQFCCTSLLSLYKRVVDIETVEETYEVSVNSVSTQRDGYEQVWFDYVAVLIIKINNSNQSIEVHVIFYFSPKPSPYLDIV